MRILKTALFVAALGVLVGCGSQTVGPDVGNDEGQQIAAVVDRMNDESNTAARLKETFASGTPIDKKQTKAYPQFRYALKTAPVVSGTTATGTVVIEKHAGGTPAEKEWAFVKEGDKWKIKTAPLP